MGGGGGWVPASSGRDFGCGVLVFLRPRPVFALFRSFLQSGKKLNRTVASFAAVASLVSVSQLALKLRKNSTQISGEITLACYVGPRR